MGKRNASSQDETTSETEQCEPATKRQRTDEPTVKAMKKVEEKKPFTDQEAE
jgi:hypothetical protein